MALAEKLFENASVPTISSAGSTGGTAVNAGLWSCDEAKVAKPDPRVYAAVKKRILAEAGLEGASEDEYILFFVASHSWDVDAAKRAG
jgi:HAD superfamily hydrolase (TIGR01493 family)